MKTYNYSDLSPEDINKLVQRNVDPAHEIRDIVEEILARVKLHGDEALYDYALKFEHVLLDKLYLTKSELMVLAQSVLPEQIAALDMAYKNIYAFHKTQLKTEDKVET